MSFRIASLNVNGLRDISKRSKLFHMFDIIVLQETHCKNNQESQYWGLQSGGTSFWNNGTSQSRGVAILIKKGLYINTENVTKDSDGRLISLTAFLSDDQTYQLTAVYAPNNGKCRKRFFTDLQHLLLQYSNPINIVGVI